MTRGGNEDRATRVSSLTDEKPLVVVETHIVVMWEVVRENCSDGCGSVVWKGKAPLCCGGCGSFFKRAFRAKDGDIGCNWGSGGHRRSEVFASRGSDEDVVGINGNVLVKRGEKEGIKDFLGDLGGSERHCR